MESSRERTLSNAGSELGSTGVPHTEVRRGLFALPGGSKAVLAFLVSITAYTVQTELAQVVQSKLGYQKPFLSLWLGHSLFSILLPCHLVFLVRRTGYPLDHWLSLIAKNLDWQLSAATKEQPNKNVASAAHGLDLGRLPSRRGLTGTIKDYLGFDLVKLVRILFILTIGITIPSLSWYAAVPMTSMADITAIYNTFSVFALVFSVFFLGESWERRKVTSVGLASIGVAIVAYGGASTGKGPSEFTNPFLGSILALLGALTMGAYEVIFTLIAKLPDEEEQARLYAKPGSKRTRSRTISGALTRSPTMTRVTAEVAVTAPPSRQRRPADVRLIFDADDAGAKPGSKGVGDGDSDAHSESNERTALVIDESISSSRTSYESISGRSASPLPSSHHQSATKPRGDEMRATSKNGEDVPSASSPTSPSLHGPSPLRQAYHAQDSESSTGASGFADSAASESEAESVLQDGEVEEILAGATRLSRSRSRSRAEVGAPSDWDEEDGDACDYHAKRSQAHSSLTNGAHARTASFRPSPRERSQSTQTLDGHWIPPPLPFGLHANIMTSGIGYVTFAVLWVGVVLGHWTGLEPFELPPNWRVVAALVGVGLLGVVFNSTFTLLLALWGPVLASVSIIGATVLVEIADVVLGHPLRVASVLGCALIVAGFVVLVGGTEEIVEDTVEHDGPPAAAP